MWFIPLALGLNAPRLVSRTDAFGFGVKGILIRKVDILTPAHELKDGPRLIAIVLLDVELYDLAVAVEKHLMQDLDERQHVIANLEAMDRRKLFGLKVFFRDTDMRRRRHKETHVKHYGSLRLKL